MDFQGRSRKKAEQKVKKPSKDCNREKEKNVLNKKMKKRKWMKVTAAKGFCGKKITMTLYRNGDSYEQYFANSLCTNVPQGSLIVIDNAPYHSRNDETYPVSKWKKQQYIDWLKSKDIAVPKKIYEPNFGPCANRKEIATRPNL